MQKVVPYHDTIARMAPQPVAIALVHDGRNKVNPITLTWYMCVSLEPPMLAISVGKARWSLKAFREAGAFTLSLPSESMQEEAVYYGTTSGRDHDKLADAGAIVQPASEINGAILSDAVANYECRIESEIEAGDHVIFIGRVAASHINDDPTVARLFTLGHRMGGVTGKK